MTSPQVERHHAHAVTGIASCISIDIGTVTTIYMLSAESTQEGMPFLCVFLILSP